MNVSLKRTSKRSAGLKNVLLLSTFLIKETVSVLLSNIKDTMHYDTMLIQGTVVMTKPS
jgi:hypothetical protein